jgi:hypothetical protein
VEAAPRHLQRLSPGAAALLPGHRRGARAGQARRLLLRRWDPLGGLFARRLAVAAGEGRAAQGLISGCCLRWLLHRRGDLDGCQDRQRRGGGQNRQRQFRPRLDRSPAGLRPGFTGGAIPAQPLLLPGADSDGQGLPRHAHLPRPAGEPDLHLAAADRPRLDPQRPALRAVAAGSHRLLPLCH